MAEAAEKASGPVPETEEEEKRRLVKQVLELQETLDGACCVHSAPHGALPFKNQRACTHAHAHAPFCPPPPLPLATLVQGF